MMPDRDSTHRWLVEQIKQAEYDVTSARMASASLGRGGERALNKALAALATAGTLLALAEAEWEREAAAVRAARGVSGAPREPSIPAGSEMQTGKPIY